MNYKNYNDYELIYMVRENDDNSYDILYNKYIPIIKNIAKNYYKKFYGYGFDYDDFIQEANIAFQIALKSFDESKNVLFYTYVSTCIQRKMISFCKKISCSKRYVPVDNYIEFDEGLICDESKNVYDDVYTNHLFSIVKNILFDLNIEDSCVFELWFNNFSYPEISTLLNLPIRTVQFKSHRIRKIFKKKMYNYLEIRK